MSHVSALFVDVVRLVIWLALLAAAFVPLERWFAIRAEGPRRVAWGPDLAFYFVNSLLPAAILAVPVGIVAGLARSVLPHWWTAALAALPLAVTMVLAFLVAEVGFYWGHRLSHEWRWLWRFHRVHHTPETMDWLVNTRAHPVDMVFTRLCGLLPLTAIGLSQPTAGGGLVALAVILAGTVWGFFIHADINWRLGPLEHLVATPRFHHWHHVEAGPINRNYAAILPLVDRVFGTLHLPGGHAWPSRYGIDTAAEAPPPRPAKPARSAAEPAPAA